MDSDLKRKRIETAVKWAAGLIGAVVISPFVFLAVKGIIGLVLAAAIGLLAINFAPVFGVWVANLALKALISAVEANPIETMLNLFSEKSAELSQADANITDFETEVRNYDDQVETFKQQYPAEAESYADIATKMREALVDMKQDQTLARVALKDFDQKIKKAKAIYKMACAAERVVELSGSMQADTFQKIKTEVAFESVQRQLNKSFAQLSTSVERRRDAKLLTAPQEVGPAIIDRPKVIKILGRQ